MKKELNLKKLGTIAQPITVDSIIELDSDRRYIFVLKQMPPLMQEHTMRRLQVTFAEMFGDDQLRAIVICESGFGGIYALDPRCNHDDMQARRGYRWCPKCGQKEEV